MAPTDPLSLKNKIEFAVDFAVDESPGDNPAKPITRRLTPWPTNEHHGLRFLATYKQLRRFYSALFKSNHQQKLDTNAVRAQIIDNALAIATMACVHANYAGEVLKVDEPKLFILTTKEGDLTQASVVYYQCQPEQHSKVVTVFRGSPAESDAGALTSLYEESKKMAASWKAKLESRGLWSVG